MTKFVKAMTILGLSSLASVAANAQQTSLYSSPLGQSIKYLDFVVPMSMNEKFCLSDRAHKPALIKFNHLVASVLSSTELDDRDGRFDQEFVVYGEPVMSPDGKSGSIKGTSTEGLQNLSAMLGRKLLNTLGSSSALLAESLCSKGPRDAMS